jgi:hypothetical protein
MLGRMQKTYQEEIGDLVTLALSCPAMGFGGGSATEERAQDRWALRVHAEAERLHRLVLGHDPKAVRIIERIQAETYRPERSAK